MYRNVLYFLYRFVLYKVRVYVVFILCREIHKKSPGHYLLGKCPISGSHPGRIRWRGKWPFVLVIFLSEFYERKYTICVVWIYTFTVQ